MRRWYKNQTSALARNLLAHRTVLSKAMDLHPRSVLGSYRGFKVDRKDPIAEKKVGDVFVLRVTRNGGCSSWTLDRKRANAFSGKSRGKVGVVVMLVSTKGIVPFLAPPERSKPWFNRMYEKTMGRAFRDKEKEYAVYGPTVKVQIVAIKR